MEKYLPAVLLLLGHVFISEALPFPPTTNDSNTTTEISGSGQAQENRTGSGESQENEKPVTISRPLNEYVGQFFLRQRFLKESNCTLTFLGQNVSKHLCNSNSIQIQFPQGYDTEGEDEYELCTNPVQEEPGETLGYDLVLYKQPTVGVENSTSCQQLLVMITEIVPFRDRNWTQLLAYRWIDRTAEGWHVFHLDPRINDRLGIPVFCVQINVLVCVEDNSTNTLFNRSQLEEMFILEETEPAKRNREPVVIVYIRKPTPLSGLSPFIPSTANPLPFKRSLPQIPSTENKIGCSIEDYIFGLSDILRRNIVTTAQIDICSVLVSPEPSSTPTTAESDSRSLERRVALTCQLDNLTVFLYPHRHNDIAIDTVSNGIICRPLLNGGKPS